MNERFVVLPHRPHPAAHDQWVLYDLASPVKVNGRSHVQVATFLDEFSATAAACVLRVHADEYDRATEALGAKEPF